MVKSYKSSLLEQRPSSLLITESGVNMLIDDPVAVVYALRGNAAFRGGRGADKTGPYTDPHALLRYFFICNIFFRNMNATMHPRTQNCLYLGHASVRLNLRRRTHADCTS